MTEQKLKDYFDGKISIDNLCSDIKDSQVRTECNTISVQLTPIKEKGEYNVTREHLINLCNETLAGHLTPTDLNTVAFGLIASEYFSWDNSTEDGKIVAETIFDWDNPDINFPITSHNLRLWKKYLETGEYSLDKKREES